MDPSEMCVSRLLSTEGWVPYCLIVTPSDFHLFQQLKQCLNRRCTENEVEVKADRWPISMGTERNYTGLKNLTSQNIYYKYFSGFYFNFELCNLLVCRALYITKNVQLHVIHNNNKVNMGADSLAGFWSINISVISLYFTTS